MTWIVVSMGGALGALCRYWVSAAVNDRMVDGVPWGTLTVNVVGCALAGIILILIQYRFPGNEFLRPLLIIGFLGAFTTFSAFSVETIQLLQSGLLLQGVINVLINVSACLIATLLGIYFARWLIGSVA